MLRMKKRNFDSTGLFEFLEPHKNVGVLVFVEKYGANLLNLQDFIPLRSATSRPTTTRGRHSEIRRVAKLDKAGLGDSERGFRCARLAD